MPKMTVAELREKVALAKQRQNANQANENIRDHVGEMMVVSGMHVTENIEIKSAGLVLDKVTYILSDGTALDGFHLAATQSAKELIDVLGEGPYDPPLMMVVAEQETKRGSVFFAKLMDIYDPDGLASFRELEESTQDAEQESFGEMTSQERIESEA